MPVSSGLVVAGVISELVGCIVFEHKQTILRQMIAIQNECRQCCQFRVIEGGVCENVIKYAVILLQKFKSFGFFLLMNIRKKKD